jgi:hypothetical protein
MQSVFLKAFYLFPKNQIKIKSTSKLYKKSVFAALNTMESQEYIQYTLVDEN